MHYTNFGLWNCLFSLVSLCKSLVFKKVKCAKAGLFKTDLVFQQLC